MSDLLSSDILEAQFGLTELTVLYQELSFVNFSRAGATQFPEVHRAVTAGTSMGKAFRAAGVAFKREERPIASQALAARFGRLFGNEGAATVITVSILVGSDEMSYAEVLEIYSPAVRWPDQT
jgi:hypothetical protein